MTATPETQRTVHVDIPLNLPLDDGGTLRVRQAIGAIPTQTEGLVVFPAVMGMFEIDDSRWHVTHVGTGLRLPAAFDDEETATGFANAVGPLAAWAEERPELSMETRLKVVELAQEHGGTLDQRILDGLARRAAKANTTKGV